MDRVVIFSTKTLEHFTVCISCLFSRPVGELCKMEAEQKSGVPVFFYITSNCSERGCTTSEHGAKWEILYFYKVFTVINHFILHNATYSAEMLVSIVRFT